MPRLGLLVCTTARARTSPAGTSSSNWIKVPGGGGSGVRMYIPPNARLSTGETNLVLAVCQAKIVPFGEERRGSRRRSFVVAIEIPKRTILSSSSQLKIFRSRLQSALAVCGLNPHCVALPDICLGFLRIGGWPSARRGRRKRKKASGLESRQTWALGGLGSGRVKPWSSMRMCMG